MPAALELNTARPCETVIAALNAGPLPRKLHIVGRDFQIVREAGRDWPGLDQRHCSEHGQPMSAQMVGPLKVVRAAEHRPLKYGLTDQANLHRCEWRCNPIVFRRQLLAARSALQAERGQISPKGSTPQRQPSLLISGVFTVTIVHPKRPS